jgi:hypothetical protein
METAMPPASPSVTASRLDRLLPVPAEHCALAPLFWQRGEDPALIRDELRRMHAYGIDGVVVESRPHPDFLGPKWWTDVDAIMDEAGKLGLRVWIFDDKVYPTGMVNGAVKTELSAQKRFLRQVTIEAPGPVPGGRVMVGPWLERDERLVAAVALACAPGDGGTLLSETAVDLTAPLGPDGSLRWDVPAGRWRVVLAIDSPTGGEDWTKDHLNPVEPGAVDLLIRTVYEPHHRRYAALAGGTFAGFFSDEPRFGSASTYEAIIGRHPTPLPWGPTLEQRLRRRWGPDFTRQLPLLFQPSGDVAARARYAYMDEATRAWRSAWSRIGDWCEERKLEWTGHVVEDNNAHARLGYGAGHFFRSRTGMHASGMDAVYQIQPAVRDGRCLTPFGDLDARFFFWGLTRLASSAAHLDPRAKGITLAECFGAYGWQHGLRAMVWLTNHLLARGVNRLVPHAWSMRWPDGDCPPHFHALGHNPQSRHFPRWAAYAARLCRALSGGEHRCEAAVLYHAEAEWAGSCQFFQDALRALALRQLDGDVMPADVLVDAEQVSCADGELVVAGGERYCCLILPWSEYQPLAVLERAAALAEAGLPVFALRGFPIAASDGDPAAAAGVLARLRAKAVIVGDDALAQAIIDRGLATVTVEPPAEREFLRLWRYRRDGRELLLVVNEDTDHDLDGATLRLPVGLPKPAAWDPMDDARVDLPMRQRGDGGWDVDLRLAANQALLLIAPGDEAQALLPVGGVPAAGVLLRSLPTTGWTVACASAEAWPTFTPAPDLAGPGDLTHQLPGFTGTARYAIDLALTEGDLAGLVIDLGEAQEVATARLNGVDLGTRLTPPYRFAAVSARVGANRLEIEVTTTLAPAHAGNGLDRAWVQRPAGLIGPVTLRRQPVA